MSTSCRLQEIYDVSEIQKLAVNPWKDGNGKHFPAELSKKIKAAVLIVFASIIRCGNCVDVNCRCTSVGAGACVNVRIGGSELSDTAALTEPMACGLLREASFRN
ncbi:unnamed protein product [Ceratitis capitata]|uniref:(Mediterranean fruit fly) hypothetical protein n=1 Tax=Ceratitis capitata TaxID=7213 RepID=A0A811UVG4_CERCA|nr:unnamed protein product [Ceratitis capitata]